MISMNDKTCYDCALFSKEHHGCLRTRTPTLSTDSCSHWVSELPICSVCGNPFVPPASYLAVEDAYVALCPTCLKANGTCGLCKSSTKCDFQENPIAIPPMVQKTVRRGNQVMTGTIPNPDRIAATCVASGCKCYHKDDEHEWCCRQFGCCGNYEMKDIKIEDKR